MAIAAVLVIAAAGSVVWRLTWVAPAWYAPPDRADPQVAQLAQRVEYRLVEEAHRIRPPEESWSLRLRQEQINAWLAARLADWASHDQRLAWLASLDPPQVSLTAGGALLAIPIPHGDRQRIIELDIAADLVDGRVKLMVNRVAVGRVSMPGSPLATLLDQLSGLPTLDPSTQQQMRETIELLFGGRAIDAALTLDDGRVVRLDDLHVGEGEVLLKCRPQPGEQQAARGLNEKQD
jgi:uncharacterized protein YpmS